MKVSPESLYTVWKASQDGAKLMTRLLRTSSPLAAYLMTAANAAVVLLRRLQVHGCPCVTIAQNLWHRHQHQS
jgi:hypothetical protein